MCRFIRNIGNLLHSYLKVKKYTDTRLPFGLKNAPAIFCRFTNLIRLMMIRRGCTCTVVYVDDFWIIAETEALANHYFDVLMTLIESLGFSVNLTKSLRACKTLTFLGIELSTDRNEDNSNLLEARVPADKLIKATELIHELRAARSVTVKTLERALGKLNFIAKVVHGARTFLRRMIDALKHAKAEHKTVVQIDNYFKLDLKFWADYLPRFNGKAIILQQPRLHPGYFATDACLEGIGGFFHGQTFGATFADLRMIATSQHLAHRHLWPEPSNARPTVGSINYKELFAVWWACVLWGHLWSGMQITIHIDNTAALAMINSGTCRSNNPQYMAILRRIFWLSCKHNFRLHGTYLSSAQNVLADRLSRGLTSSRDFVEAFRAWGSQQSPNLSLPH